MSTPAPSRTSRSWIVLHVILALVILIPAGYGFGSKFRELVLLWNQYNDKPASTLQTNSSPPMVGTVDQAEPTLARAPAGQQKPQVIADESTDGGFAMVPVMNYLLVSIGFFLLFCAAILHGMFRDIEKPKRDMLEKEWVLDDMERSAYAETTMATSSQ